MLRAFAYILVMRVQTLHQLANLVRSRRQLAGLTQAQLAERASVSRWWISEFESAKARAEIGLVMRVLAALDLSLDISPREETRAPTDDRIDLDAHIAEYLER